MFITSKIRAEYKTYDEAKKSIDESLNKLGLDYIDLMIIHAPTPWNEFRETDKKYFEENLEVWKALEDAYDEGKVKAIGVSNFHIEDLDNILKNCRIKPMVNQVLSHVGQTPFNLIEYCNKNQIVVEAYSPIAHGEAYRIKEVENIGKKNNRSFAQVCLKHQLQLGLVVLPKASEIEHLKENIDLDFELSEQEMNILNLVRPLDDYGKDDYFPVFKHSGE